MLSTDLERIVQFQPTLPVRGATMTWRKASVPKKFQPTLPVRGATALCLDGIEEVLFQPTLPVRGATLYTGLGVPSS